MAMIDKIVYAVSLQILYKEEIIFCIMSAEYPLDSCFFYDIGVSVYYMVNHDIKMYICVLDLIS